MLVGSPKKRFLVVFAHVFQEFRLPELLSVCQLHDIELEHDGYSEEHPYCIIRVADEKHISTLLNRCVMIQFIVEVWEEHRSREGLCKAPFSNYPTSSYSFNILLHSFGRKVPATEKIDLIESMEHLPLSGKVDCRDPDRVFYIVERYTDRTAGPTDVYFGPLVGRGTREILDKFSVKKRLYIGRTTMDAQLSFLMANLALIRPGCLTYDPFLGTGSLLIPPAYHASYCFGSDIDIKALKGWGKSTKQGEERYEQDQNVEGNMLSYGLERYYLGCHASDFSSGVLRRVPFFDVIVTDPPYGIREASLRVNKDIKNSQYSLSEQFLELLNFAAATLVLGGRLVYWIPVIRDLYTPASLPLHPALTLKYNCQQVLTKKSARRLLVMIKTRECSAEDASFVQGDNTSHNQYREVYFSKT